MRSSDPDERREQGREHEEHGHEEQAAPEEDGREELVLGVADMGADGTHEPEEEDPAEWHKSERKPEFAAAARLGQPCPGGVRVYRHDSAEQDDDDAEQQGEQYPGEPKQRGESGAPLE